jgi:pimeloyl-ACP methyl ester carboxylesterase
VQWISLVKPIVSLGANQVALFTAERSPDLIRAVVLLAPTTWNDTFFAKSYAARAGRELKPVIDRAYALVTAGNGDQMMPDTQCLISAETTSVSAASFASYYSTAPDRDTPNLIPRIKKPVLVLAGENDTTRYKIAEKFAPVVDGKRVQIRTIDGAYAFFRDLYAEDAVDAILEFVAGH